MESHRQRARRASGLSGKTGSPFGWIYGSVRWIDYNAEDAGLEGSSPSARCAGRGDSRRCVVHPAVSSIARSQSLKERLGCGGVTAWIPMRVGGEIPAEGIAL